MTRHRATALLGVAAAMLLTAGALAAGSPAFAAGDSVKVSVLPLQTFTPGQTQTLQVQIEYKRDPKSTAPGTFQVSLSGLGGDFTVGNPEGCAFPCVVTFADSDSKVVKFPIKASGDVQPGDKKNANGKVTAAGFNDVNDSANFSATINGPEQAQTVTQVSGTVKDPNGAAVANATVAMLDGGSCTTSNRCETATNSRGEFSFKPKPDKPIVPGTIRIGATRSGFEVGQATQDARAGQSVTINLTLRPKAAATSSANASEEALPAPPSDAAATTQQAAQPETTKTSDSGSSAFSWVIIALAGLLVLLGVGVIVMMLINRRKNEGDDPEGGDPAGPAGPGGPGVYGGEPAGHGMGGAPTVVGGPQVPPGPGDAATAIIQAQRPEDEYPDPYAAYPASPGGYQPAAGGYDPNPNSYGGNATAAYGAGYHAGQQPQQGGYDPYGQPPQNGYGPPPTQQYGGPPPQQQPGYPQPQPGGYDPGYGQQPQNGYAPPPTQQWGGAPQQHQDYPPQQGGYGQQQPPPARDPYYDEHTGRGAPPAGQGGDRRSLGWLDD